MICWVQITAGRGPEECCWVVSRLTRYFIDDAGRHGFEAKVLDVVPGSGSNTIHSALIAVEGPDGVTEYVKSWQGTVQWIGQSMFRPRHKRKNWFVSVRVLDKSKKCEELDEGNIRIERMRSSGPGGQHVNKTETAVRVTHVPTGLSTISREERSQHLNKVLAIARLQELLSQKIQEEEMIFQKERWRRHNEVERGNATRVFTGRNFKLKNN